MNFRGGCKTAPANQTCHETEIDAIRIRKAGGRTETRGIYERTSVSAGGHFRFSATVATRVHRACTGLAATPLQLVARATFRFALTPGVILLSLSFFFSHVPAVRYGRERCPRHECE